MSDIKNTPEDIRKQVMDRVDEEKSTASVEEKTSKKKLSTDFIKTCLDDNRVRACAGYQNSYYHAFTTKFPTLKLTNRAGHHGPSRRQNCFCLGS